MDQAFVSETCFQDLLLPHVSHEAHAWTGVSAAGTGFCSLISCSLTKNKTWFHELGFPETLVTQPTKRSFI